MGPDLQYRGRAITAADVQGIRDLIAARAGLGRSPSSDELSAAATMLGVSADDAAALARPAASDADVVAVGRILARVEGESRP